MDTDVDLLTVMAEVAIALAGFTGLVVVLGRRAQGDCATARIVAQWAAALPAGAVNEP